MGRRKGLTGSGPRGVPLSKSRRIRLTRSSAWDSSVPRRESSVSSEGPLCDWACVGAADSVDRVAVVVAVAMAAGK